MKNFAYFLVFSLCILVSSCNKDDAYDITETIITEEEPTEGTPDITIRTIDGVGQSVPEAAITVYVNGVNEVQEITDANGEAQITLPTLPEGERAFLFGEKTLYDENLIRIEPEDIQAGVVEIVLRQPEPIDGYDGSNVLPLITSSSVLVNGMVTDPLGNPAEGEVLIFEGSLFSGGFSNSVNLDANGYYEMLVPDNQNLLLLILPDEDCTPFNIFLNEPDVPMPPFPFYAENIGPFTQDTTLPTNTNATPNEEVSINVMGTIMDCDNNPFPNSKLLFSNRDGEVMDSLYTDATGAFNTIVEVTICGGSDMLIIEVIPPASTGLDNGEFYADFSSSDTQIDFGTLNIGGGCGNFLTFTDDDENNIIILEPIELVNYDPNAMLVITESDVLTGPLGSGEINLVIEKNGPQNWSITTFEYVRDGVSLYVNNGTPVVILQDNGTTIFCVIQGLIVDVLSGPNAGQTLELSGALAVNY